MGAYYVELKVKGNDTFVNDNTWLMKWVICQTQTMNISSIKAKSLYTLSYNLLCDIFHKC